MNVKNTLSRLLDALKAESASLAEKAANTNRPANRRERDARLAAEFVSVAEWISSWEEDSWGWNEDAAWERSLIRQDDSTDAVDFQKLEYWLVVSQGWKRIDGVLTPPDDE